jgi:DNA-binding NtrC family response regulator
LVCQGLAVEGQALDLDISLSGPKTRHFVRRFSRELGREVQEIAPEALDRLRGYSWPGNIRELQSALKQALLQASGTLLLPSFLPWFRRWPMRGANPFCGHKRKQC